MNILSLKLADFGRSGMKSGYIYVVAFITRGRNLDFVEQSGIILFDSYGPGVNFALNSRFAVFSKSPKLFIFNFKLAVYG